jgi:partner of Y14 and mago protein
MSSQLPSSGSDPSLAGLVKDENDNFVVPESRRKDGTIRKERKVKPGYVPPEDIPRFQTRRGQSPKPSLPPGAPVKAVDSKKGKENKEKKDQERKKKEADNLDRIARLLGDTHIGAKMAKKSTASTTATTQSSTTPCSATKSNDQLLYEREKKIKSLQKKLKQIEQLKARKDAGETLEVEQIVKLGRLEEFRNDLRKLEEQQL